MPVSYPSKAKLPCSIRIFLDRLFCPATRDVNTSQNDMLFIFLFLSFIRTQITKLCSSAFTRVSLRFIFQSGRQLSSFFSFKNRIPAFMRSRVVYKYTCQCCGSLYFVQTRRHSCTRISEHSMEVSPLRGKKLATTSLSSIQAHIHHTHHTISPNDFSIISSCHSSSNFELLIRESLLISKFKPSLNENISSTPLSLF